MEQDDAWRPGNVLNQASDLSQANMLTSAELKRRGIAAIEQALQHGPVHLIKRNQAAAVVLSEQHYRQLQLQASRAPAPEGSASQPSALHWLLTVPPTESPRSKASIDAELAAERDW
jgi:PHD/YefM family antitoxin component YafN of YafNO toxin-antitoxin module